MVKLDHLAVFVKDRQRSRDWYIKHFGFKLEFQTDATVALQDDAALTIFFTEARSEIQPKSCTLILQVDDVEAAFRRLSAAGVEFISPPQKLFWGYGAELLDPDGYQINLWDQATMREKGGGDAA